MATLAELLVKVDVDTDQLESGSKNAASDVERSFDRAGRGVAQSFDKAEAAAAGSFRGIGQDAERAGTKIEGAGDGAGEGFADGITSAMSGLSSKMSGFASDAVDEFTGAFAIGGAAAGVALIAGIDEAMSREAGVDRLAAQLGLSPQESERAGKIAGELYADAYGESLGEVNDTVDAVLSTLETQSEAAAKRASRDALNIASAYETDVVEAVSLAGFSMESGLVDSTDEAFDLIIASMQRMPAGMREELFPIIEEYGVFLEALGFTGEDAFGLIVTASEGGTFALDKTLDALKEFTIRSTDMSATTAEAFETIGLDMETMAAKIVAGGPEANAALQDIVEGILAIEDPVDRANTAIALFGTPLEDLSVDQIPAFLEQLLNTDSTLGDVAGTAEEFDQTLNDNVQTRFEEIKRAVIGFVVDAIDRFLLPALDAISRWAQDNPMLFQLMAVAVGALAAAFIGLAVAAAIATLAAAPWIATALIVAGVVAALILVIGLLIIFWDEVSAAAGAAWDFIKEKAMQAFNWIKKNWPLILAILTGPIGLAVLAIIKHWDTIKRGVGAAIQWIRDRWNQAVGWIKDRASNVKQWIVDRWNDVVSFIKGLPGRIARAASGLWDGIKDAFKSAINTVIGWWNGIQFTLPTIDIPSVSLGPLGSIGGGSFGGWTFGTPDIPMLAAGGIITDPTLAMLGEGRFKEAVIPLPRGLRDLGGAGGSTVVVNVQGSILTERELVGVIRDELNRGGFGGVR